MRMNRPNTYHYTKRGGGNMDANGQAPKEQVRGRRYQTSISMTGHVTHGLKRGRERGLTAKAA